ncbi:MAG TPA: YbaK/EbsC family protein [Mycobacteriales bacterium]|nr:YbaK/EbsC family protein [Mycobacteriales bacterium]
MTLHPSVQRVQDALAALGCTAQVRLLENSARTAAQAAAALGVLVGQIANSLVFDADGQIVLVLTSGAHRADPLALGAVLSANRVAPATPDVVRRTTGFAIGGVAPVGHPKPLRTLVDIDLARYDVVWAAAGHPHAVFPTSYDELLRLTAGSSAEVE